MLRKALYFLLAAAVLCWLGFAVVDSWTEALAFSPAVLLLAWLTFRVWWLLDDQARDKRRYEHLSESLSETLAQLEFAQLRVDALGLMEIRVVWLNADELEQLAERVKVGPHLSTWSPRLKASTSCRWMRARSRLPFLAGRGLDERTARVWPLEVAEAERLGRGIPSIEAIVSASSMTHFASALTDDQRSRSR